jgi:hypothetical protein
MIGRLFPPYDMAEMPASMQRLPTTSKGIPIPWSSSGGGRAA